MLMEELIERLARATIGATFNFYRDGDGAASRRERLRAFTSERQLTGRGPAEASATIVHRALEELELEESVLLWNVVPTHPGTATSNRRPTRAEVEQARPFLEELAAGRRAIAVGRVAESVLGGPYLRHPSHGGAADFRAGLLRFAPGGRKVRRFHA